MGECSAIDCDIKDLSLNQIVSMLVQSDTNGEPALNTVEAVGVNELFITCDNNGLIDYETLVRQMLVWDVNGNLAIKIIKSTI